MCLQVVAAAAREFVRRHGVASAVLPCALSLAVALTFANFAWGLPDCDGTAPKKVRCPSAPSIPDCDSYEFEDCDINRETQQEENDFTNIGNQGNTKLAEQSAGKFDCWCYFTCALSAGGCIRADINCDLNSKVRDYIWEPKECNPTE